jgi:spermidine export protein MdtI
MLPSFEPIHAVYLAIAIALEVAANVLMKQSRGLTRWIPGVAAIACALAAFTALSFAIKGIELSVAYGIWGGVGLLATTLFGIALFRERVTPTGWIGMLLIMAGVILMKFA